MQRGFITCTYTSIKLYMSQHGDVLYTCDAPADFSCPRHLAIMITCT